MQRSDAQRLDALTRMFQRFDYPKLEAVARARLLYYMQIGYDDARLGEPMSARNALMPAYLVGFTGQRHHVITSRYRIEERFVAEHPEVGHEPLEVLIRELLVGKRQHVMFHPGGAQRLHRLRIEIPGQVHPRYRRTAGLA